MSITLLSKCWSKQFEKRSHREIVQVLCDHANDDGICWPSQARIAWATDLSLHTVKVVMRHLREIGLVTVLANGKGGYKRTPVLQIDLSVLADKKPFMGGKPLTPFSDNEGGKKERGVSSTPPMGGKPLTPEPSIEPSVKKTIPSVLYAEAYAATEFEDDEGREGKTFTVDELPEHLREDWSDVFDDHEAEPPEKPEPGAKQEEEKQQEPEVKPKPVPVEKYWTNLFYGGVAESYGVKLRHDQYGFHVKQFQRMIGQYAPEDQEMERILAYMIRKYPSMPKIDALGAIQDVRLGRDTGEAWEGPAPWEEARAKQKADAEPINPHSDRGERMRGKPRRDHWYLAAYPDLKEKVIISAIRTLDSHREITEALDEATRQEEQKALPEGTRRVIRGELPPARDGDQDGGAVR